LVHSRKRKRLFRTWLVETGVVDAHPKLPPSIRDDNKLGQPPRVVHIPD
jgi:hypothetical protein